MLDRYHGNGPVLEDSKPEKNQSDCVKQLEVALANGYEGPRSKRIFKLKEVQY